MVVTIVAFFSPDGIIPVRDEIARMRLICSSDQERCK